MNMNLSEKLKSLRAEKGVSQEKLANYLNISFQAVSKWETGSAMPDIMLLPAISRFYGITVDELLQAETLDEHALFEEYNARSYDLFRCGDREENLKIWQEAYQKMPNSAEVKEMLMSAYYDTDKIKYKDEIIELGTELYNSDAGLFYKGQAIKEIADTYYANGNKELAEKWAYNSYFIYHSHEVILSRIAEGEELLSVFNFFNYWYFECVFYMAIRVYEDDKSPLDLRQKQEIFKTLLRFYEALYPNGDMAFESIEHVRLMHEFIAEIECELDRDETTIRSHLQNELECVMSSMNAVEHKLTHPLLFGWHAPGAPSDNKQYARFMLNDLREPCFDAFRDAPWFTELERQLASISK